MRIVMDLQGCQTPGSRHRGIGRYSMSLARSLVQEGANHEFHVLLSGAFPDSIEPIRAAFGGLLPAGRFHVFHVPPGCADRATPPSWRARAAESIRRCAIQQLQPDFVHVSSLFEGFADDHVAHVDPRLDGVPTAVTLYDFIPYLYPKRYLGSTPMRAWYERKLDSLRRAALVLGISASACAEADSVLGAGHGRVVNISSAADPDVFRPAAPAGAARRFGLDRPFVMYTGGAEWRKNIEGLMAAFASLPSGLRERHQLAIVCDAKPHARTHLLAHAKQLGLSTREFVLTGFVSDEELADLYRSCELFVFPSLHEGFGLPVLEALMCGAPVIGSNASSIPEVIGRDDALFDPRSTESIAALMRRALEDAGFRASLRAHASSQAERFSWRKTARTALDAIEQVHASQHVARVAAAPVARPRLAMHAPLPPARSGIADYACELAHALAPHYEIELVHDQREVALPDALRDVPVRDAAAFRRDAKTYDRVLYHFGNSLLHGHMFALLREVPGVVVLHDFFLSGALGWMEMFGVEPDALRKGLLRSHGAHAIEFERTQGRDAAIQEFPANRFVLERAAGIVVHSRYAVDSARRWYGDAYPDGWRIIPHLRTVPTVGDRAQARRELGLAPDDFLICCFGHLGAKKFNDRLLRSWTASSLGSDPRCRLVFVGENARPPFGDEMQRLVSAAPRGRVAITGYADRETYQRYLRSADVAVQLRSEGRGETSGALLDCLAWGVPLIVNAHGANTEYPDGVFCRLEDSFSDEELVNALERLRHDTAQRERLVSAGRSHVAAVHEPARVARLYRDAIEAFSARPQHEPYWTAVNAIGALGRAAADRLHDAAVALEATYRGAPASSR